MTGGVVGHHAIAALISRRCLLVLSLVLSMPHAVVARDIRIEFLRADISPRTVSFLAGAYCRNVDKIVHLKLSVNWPSESLDREGKDFKRLIFWAKGAEYLFPDGSFEFLHGDYVINGYFIARSGGMHQGMESRAFERVDDAKILLNPAVVEVPMRKAGCK